MASGYSGGGFAQAAFIGRGSTVRVGISAACGEAPAGTAGLKGHGLAGDFRERVEYSPVSLAFGSGDRLGQGERPSRVFLGLRFPTAPSLVVITGIWGCSSDSTAIATFMCSTPVSPELFLGCSLQLCGYLEL